MNIKNFEFKVKVNEILPYENRLLALNPVFKGVDRQCDTYFQANSGRLKLREGNIEHALIQYERENISGSKLSNIQLFRFGPDPALKSILETQLGISVVVRKVRKIYFIGNVKFHFDEVEGLGSFAEVEAIDVDNQFTVGELSRQCDHYFDYLQFKPDMLMAASYADMLLS